MDLKKVKELRNQTGAPLLLIKEALLKSDDLDKAKEWLDKNWRSSNRNAGFSVICSKVHNHRIGVMVEVSCGTDFVAATQEFKEFCNEVLLQLIAGLEGNLEDQVWVKDPSLTIKELMEQVSKKTGETVKIERSIRWSV